jgi:N-methylhydantoinase A
MIIGLDVGGTHTDAVLLGPDGYLDGIKVPTDHDDLFHTVLGALDTISRRVAPSQIARIVLSTTLTTNAVVQNNLAPVGMIVAAGPGIDPNLFRTNADYCPVSGAIDHRGREVAPIAGDEIRRAADRFQSRGIRLVGVVTKFSVRNPQHEKEIAQLLAGRFETLFLGHRTAGNLNFPRRVATTYLNAAVYPIHKSFFEAVHHSLVRKGINAPIRILKADGGNMRFSSSIDNPAQTILSGPAASVMGALAFAPPNRDCLVLDIGGTTTDMAILVNGVPLLEPVGIDIGPYRTLVRSLQTHSIGVGGDSAVRLDGDQLRIGPDRDGPPMMAGGRLPTPTDAMRVLGMVTEGDRQASAAGLSALAGASGRSVAQTATAILDATCRRIMSAADSMIAAINRKPVYTVHEMLAGHRVRPSRILVLGGPAFHFAERLRAFSDAEVTAIPRWQVANAIGAALARTTSDVQLFCDTQQGTATAPEEDYFQTVGSDFTLAKAIDVAMDLLRSKALARGANAEQLDAQTVEALEFNMVRGFTTTGRNIRVRVQITPGLIPGIDLGDP